MRFTFLFILIACLNSIYGQTEAEITARFKKDISYLSSDMLEGRLTGSSGELRSSLYIADEFKSFGLQPMGDSGNYLQEFNIVRLRISNSKSFLRIIEKDMRIGILASRLGEFYPLSYSCSLDSINLPVFQAGYGINTKEYNDYKDTTDIRGKIFAIQLGSPTYGKNNNIFEPYESLAYKVEEAIKRGARGIIFIRTDTLTSIPKGQLDRSIKPTNIPIIYATKKSESIMNAKEIEMKVSIAQLDAKAHNVIGFMNNKKKQTIVIGAHQDHLGYNEYGSSRSKAEGKIHNGADDNASGVAMMLELMRKIKSSKKLKKYNYLFIAFTGEEQGLIGSKYFVNNPTINLKKVRFMLNFDMVGRLDSIKKTMLVYGVGTSPVWKNALQKLITDSAQVKIKTSESGTGSSDHTNFYNQNIPVLHFFTGQHQDYHMPTDDEHLINYHGMYLGYDIVIKLLKNTRKTKPFPFTSTKNEMAIGANFKVSLGVMPDYAFNGNGMRLDGITPDKSGAKAGLQKGDIITKLGAYTVSHIEDYMKALSTYNKGDTSTVIIKRGTEEKIVIITF